MPDTARIMGAEAWDEACKKDSPTAGRLGEVVDRCMASLQMPVDGSPVRGYGPWPRPEERCYGAMWAGVMGGVNWLPNESGGCMLARPPAYLGDSPKGYIRLSPAPSDAEVQFGFCPLTLNKWEEIIHRESGEEGPSVRALDISMSRSALFRVDRVVGAILTLCDKRDTTEEGLEFRRLLGDTPLCCYVEDIMRSCCVETSEGRNVLVGRDTTYQKMGQIVALRLHPNLFSPDTSTDLAPLSRALGVRSVSNHATVWPQVLNVVMPEPIFTVVLENLKKGIPPVVPQYVTYQGHMFNGCWASPCTGELSLSSWPSGLSRKLLAGVLNASNEDMAGPASFWAGSHNPPQEWVGKFVDVVQGLGRMSMPLGRNERIDLALMVAREIPVMMVLNPRNVEAPLRKFAKLVGVKPHATRECTCTGSDWAGPPSSETVVSNPPGSEVSEDENDGEDGREEFECQECDYTTPDETNLIICRLCELLHCVDCVARCGSCGNYYCDSCNANNEHSCNLERGDDGS